MILRRRIRRSRRRSLLGDFHFFGGAFLTSKSPETLDYATPQKRVGWLTRLADRMEMRVWELVGLAVALLFAVGFGLAPYVITVVLK